LAVAQDHVFGKSHQWPFLYTINIPRLGFRSPFLPTVTFDRSNAIAF
jgi:hypothetical protein